MFLPKSNNRRIHRTSLSSWCRFVFLLSGSAGDLDILHSSLSAFILAEGGSGVGSVMDTWWPFYQEAAAGKKFDAESFSLADLSLLHLRHGSAAVSLSLHHAVVNQNRKFSGERTVWLVFICRWNGTARHHRLFFFFFCSCLDSPPIRIEYKQPVCNEAADDSPALPFVGLRLWLPTAFEMCLMCCDV